MGFKSSRMGSAPRPPQVGFVGEDKWKLASQLQKAIRHGHVEVAAVAARDLHGIEPAYLRYRLSVIAVEDVAAGSPETVLSAFEGGWRKAEVEARGGQGFLEKVARDFAAAPKDRTPCDLMYATRFLSDFQAIHGPWGDMSWDRAMEMALAPGQPWFVRALSAWRCAGTDKFKPRSQILPEVAGDWDRWVKINGEAFGQQAANLMRVGEHQREHHHVFIGLALSAQRDPGAGLIRPDIPVLPRIGYWLSAALDKHTSEGRRALSRLPAMAPASSQSLVAAGIAVDVQPDLIGRLWFWEEGSRCAIEHDHSMSRAIRQDNQQRTLAGLPRQALDDAFGDTRLWQRARESAMGLRPSPPSP